MKYFLFIFLLGCTDLGQLEKDIDDLNIRLERLIRVTGSATVCLRAFKLLEKNEMLPPINVKKAYKLCMDLSSEYWEETDERSK